MYPKLISSLPFINKSLEISTLSFSIAKYNAVLSINNILNFALNSIERYDFECYWKKKIINDIEKTWIWMLLKDMTINVIGRYDFEFHLKIWFWILLKDIILNFIERYDFEFHWKISFWMKFEWYKFELY